MKFEGTPNMLVMCHKPKKNLRFDKEGFLETDNPRLQILLKKKFKVVDGEVVEVKTEPEIKQYTCKTCGLKFDDKSTLMKHIYAEHRRKESENEN